MRPLAAFAVALAATTLVTGAAFAGKPDPALAPMRLLLGQWQASVETMATRYTKPGHESNTLVNDCWGSNQFFTCTQTLDGAPGALLIYAVSEAPEGKTAPAGGFDTYAIPAPGAVPRHGLLTIRGNTWVYDGTIDDHGKRVQVRTTNVFATPTLIRFKTEFSDDGKSWTVMNQGENRKTSK